MKITKSSLPSKTTAKCKKLVSRDSWVDHESSWLMSHSSCGYDVRRLNYNCWLWVYQGLRQPLLFRTGAPTASCLTICLFRPRRPMALAAVGTVPLKSRRSWRTARLTYTLTTQSVTSRCVGLLVYWRVPWCSISTWWSSASRTISWRYRTASGCQVRASRTRCRWEWDTWVRPAAAPAIRSDVTSPTTITSALRSLLHFSSPFHTGNCSFESRAKFAKYREHVLYCEIEFRKWFISKVDCSH